MIASLLGPAPAIAQVEIVEEEEAEEQIVERGHVRGQGRGVQYGAYLMSPIYLTDVRRAGAVPDALIVGAGAGVHARIGWEFPSGFALEVFGGVGGNAVDTQGATDVSNVFLRGDVGLAARYLFFNETAFVPFVQIGAQARFFTFDWSTDPTMGREVAGETVLALNAAVGAQVELTPYFGIEFGLAVDYGFGFDLFSEGLLSLMPFAGVTLYLQDENDPIDT